jgi:hypothetical protein
MTMMIFKIDSWVICEINSREDLIYHSKCNAFFRNTEEILETDNGWKELRSQQEHR